MGTATVEQLSPAQAEAERERLMTEVGRTMVDLDERAADGLLDAQEFRVWRRLRALNWLLGADA